MSCARLWQLTKQGALLRDDVNEGHNVNISDATILINHLLSHNWPE